jgi:glycosyltransferase involved in cell wall biosynthesis
MNLAASTPTARAAVERLSVMFAIPELDKAGPDRVLFELLSSLDRERFAPSLLVSSDKGYYLTRLPSDVEVVVARAKRLPRYPVVESVRAVRRRAPDVVFATLRMTLTLGLGAFAFPRRTKLILRQANDLTADFALLVKRTRIKHRLAKQVTLAALRQADAIVCQSDAMRDDLKQLGIRVPKHVIGNPVDVAAAQRAGAAREATVLGSPSLVAVGRLSAQKGHDLLLRAIAIVRATHPNVHLTIVGEGPDRADLEQLARSLGIANNVTFAGFVPEPLPLVKAADLFVLCSRYEGFPNAVLEALALGKPVVVTDCPGANAKIVRGDFNGEISPTIDEHGFATATLRALEHRARYSPSKIVEDCDARFGAKRIVGEYQDLFSSIGGTR